jgi:hypothetical protein
MEKFSRAEMDDLHVLYKIIFYSKEESAVGRKTSNGAETYKTIRVYESVDFYDARGIEMEDQAAKLNIERKMALLQKEEIENREKILELEHALRKNEEIMS